MPNSVSLSRFVAQDKKCHPGSLALPPGSGGKGRCGQVSVSGSKKILNKNKKLLTYSCSGWVCEAKLARFVDKEGMKTQWTWCP